MRIPEVSILRAATLTSAVLASACTDPIATSTEQPVVYGEDDRQDVYAFGDPAWAARAAEVSAALISTSDINATNPNAIQLDARTLQQELNLCAGERFADQLTAAWCSATLIAPDLVLTAGHCVSSCSGVSFVFDYYMDDATTRHTITSDDVYACQQIVVRQVGGADYAVVRLDRNVVGRTPATVAEVAATVPVNTPLTVQGYPSGLPLKIDDGGWVRDAREATLDFFVANLDTFGGNSGSGVYRTDNGQLVGILVRGEADYVQDGSCIRVNVCADTGCRGEDSTYAFRAIEALCDVAPIAGLCSCGDGTCDTDDGETTATCPLDCGTACGDGTCNGDESPLTCTDDCGTCGNAVCDEDPGDCCTDCGCDGTDVCVANACIPDPGPGDRCDAPLPITPTGTQTLTGDTTHAQNDYAGSCVGGGARDRVYSFTLTSETLVDAQVTGFDTGLYLRTICDQTSTEVACNDDSTPPGGTGSRIVRILDPGTYYLVVDGFGTSAGAYTLTISFDEPVSPPGATCGDAIAIEPTGTQVITGSTTFTGADLQGSCSSGGAEAEDQVYAFTLPGRATVVAEVEGFDTLLYARSTCDDADTELACNDDNDPPGGLGSRIELPALAAGTYFLIVDGFHAGSAGPYTLTVTFERCPGDGDTDGDGVCDDDDACPDDPDKTEPGVCGCGEPEVDGCGAPIEPPVDDDDDDSGCGCQGGGSPGTGALLIGVALFGLRRRRRRVG
jgi:MYXO-CTERM domain-containing protein